MSITRHFTSRPRGQRDRTGAAISRQRRMISRQRRITLLLYRFRCGSGFGPRFPERCREMNEERYAGLSARFNQLRAKVHLRSMVRTGAPCSSAISWMLSPLK